MKNFILITVIVITDKMFNICQNDEPSVMLIQLIESDLFFLIIVNSVEVTEFNDLDTQIFIIRNKKLFQFIDVDLILIYMQIIQIKAFIFKNVNVKCINQISDLFVAFINLCNVINE